jgi:ATP-binding cassette, subfamily B, multidrug efflux pump
MIAQAQQPVAAPVAGVGGGVGARLGALTRPWWPLLGVVALLVVLAAVLQLAPPLIVRSLVDDHLAIGDSHGLVLLACFFLIATAGTQALTFAYTYLAAVIAQAVLSTLRVRLFAHLQALPTAYYDQTPLGDAISRCTADVETVDTLFSSGVSALVANLVLVLTTGIAMAVLSPPLALVSALSLPFLLAITRYFQVRTRAAERLNRIAVGSINAELQESLGGMEVIRAFGREGVFLQRFRQTLHGALVAYNRSTVYGALYTPTMAILAGLVTALLLWAGTRDELVAWGISVGTLTAFVLVFQRFFKPIVDLGDQWQTVQAALAGVERIFQVLALPADNPTPSARPSARISAPIEIHDVVFGYVEERPILQGIRLEVRPGEQVALVGRTGAGKTSLLHLVAGLYTPRAGSIRVVGADPRSVPEDSRRRLIGVVPQTVHLFSGSILDNLTLGDTSLSLDEVEAAARVAGLHAFIRSLSAGYATRVGGGAGMQLSAGQQQLLALARALVWNPPVILLDEATSAIDNASDTAFRTALASVVRDQGKAVLTIAHRLATACDADRVIVLEHGRIVEQGSPAALSHPGSRFAALLELEASGWDWATATTSSAAISTC